MNKSSNKSTRLVESFEDFVGKGGIINEGVNGPEFRETDNRFPNKYNDLISKFVPNGKYVCILGGLKVSTGGISRTSFSKGDKIELADGYINSDNFIFYKFYSIDSDGDRVSLNGQLSGGRALESTDNTFKYFNPFRDNPFNPSNFFQYFKPFVPQQQDVTDWKSEAEKWKSMYDELLASTSTTPKRTRRM
jgi:hypothetical protein